MINMSMPLVMARELLKETDVLTGRVSLFLRGVITLGGFPVQYYGEPLTNLNFLDCLGEAPDEWEQVGSFRHVKEDVAVVDVINGLFDKGIGLQEFEETIIEYDVLNNVDLYLDRVNKKEEFLTLLEEWRPMIENDYKR